MSSSFGNVSDNSQTNLESSFFSQSEKKKTVGESKDSQPIWMEGRNNNRLSQGFGLAAAVAASEIKN